MRDKRIHRGTPIPAHILDALQIVTRGIYTDSRDYPPVEAILFAAILTHGLDEHYQLARYLIECPRIYERGMVEGFDPQFVN